ncbi:MAG: hypothetical protein ACFFDX_10965 [Candidatus Odinarchaeota archaeon]
MNMKKVADISVRKIIRMGCKKLNNVPIIRNNNCKGIGNNNINIALNFATRILNRATHYYFAF